jgi:uncharacterized membrane protein YjjB (DUF3815 family)
MNSDKTQVVLWSLFAIAACLSCYGWWFYFNVGQTHGPGLELGIAAAALAFVFLGSAMRRRAKTMTRSRKGD